MYDETDIRKILNRAFELQSRREESAGGSMPVDQKLTLEEIEQIARELDLPAEYVRHAAMEYEGIPTKEPLFIETDGPHKVELLGFVNGRPDQKAWAELRAIIEYHFDSPGKVRRRPDGITWEARPQGVLKFLHTRKSPRVEIKSSGDSSTIRIRQNLKTYGRLLYPAYASLAGAAMLVAVAMTESAPEVLFMSAFLVGTAQIFRFFSDRKKRKTREHLKDMMEQLQTILTRRSSAAELAETGWTDRLHVPEEDDENALTEEEKRGRSHRQKTH